MHGVKIPLSSLDDEEGEVLDTVPRFIRRVAPFEDTFEQRRNWRFPVPGQNKDGGDGGFFV